MSTHVLETSPKDIFESLDRAFTDPVKRRKLDHARVLVLNADYRPISILPLNTQHWKEAVVNSLVLGKVDEIEWYDDLVVRSPSVTWAVPSVVVNRQYVSSKRRVQFMRQNLLLRDDYTCQYCGKRHAAVDLTYDHLVPRVKGGKTEWTNIVMACGKCNNAKGRKMASEWKTPLGTYGPLKKPVEPTYAQLEAKVRRGPLVIPDPSWAQYLGWEGPLFVNDGTRQYQLSGPESEVPADEIGF